jgi:hypothetical protein
VHGFALLDDVNELVSQEVTPRNSIRGIFAASEDDMSANGDRPRAEAPRDGCRGTISVNTYRCETHAESWLEIRAICR